ncbi:hypothetical protein OCS_06665 [Ophiocordyceps sinensis CO18]|uniref:Uncharacterized protein n=1 Tax=Ophiocordyceps sinensis (strain Co18 / CGMCC 3.14243) TaxID=911162 RepID=T5A767_OPHSC|nr:hypothetical protein OCS_06665 [Ophiocordyceps sinensis CO18]
MASSPFPASAPCFRLRRHDGFVALFPALSPRRLRRPVPGFVATTASSPRRPHRYDDFVAFIPLFGLVATLASSAPSARLRRHNGFVAPFFFPCFF